MTPFFGKTKPSEFLQAMVDGLRDSVGRDDRQLSMGTYGMVVARLDHERVCAGCAATWALHTLAGKKELELDAFHTRGGGWFYPDNYFPEPQARIREFECVIDSVRVGIMSDALRHWPGLENFCCLQPGTLQKWEKRWHIESAADLDQLQLVENAIWDMETLGL